MPDLDERFRSFSRTHAPDLWPDIEGRDPRPMPDDQQGRRAIAAAVAVVVATAGIGLAIRAFDAGDAARLPAVSGPARIVFSAASDEDFDLFSMEPDGTDVRPLTDTPANEEEPAASVDGTMLAFDLREPGEAASHLIAVSGAKGVGVRDVPGTRLEGGNPVTSPSWSPDGSQIAFAAYGDGGGIYVAGVDGGEARRLTSAGPPTIHVDSDPAWSPDGGSIAFIRWIIGDAEQSPAYEILEVGMDGGEPRLIARFPTPTQGNPSDSGAIDGLSWSPDGSRLAFARYGAVYKVDVESGGSRELVSCEELGCDERTGVSTDSPSWSPDGRRIAFTVWLNNPEARAESPIIYVADLDGDRVTVTSTGIGGLFPAWLPSTTGSSPSPTIEPSPANGLIAVAVGPDADIVLIDPGTGVSTPLVERHGEGQEGGLQMAWSPDGSMLAYTDYRGDGSLGLFALDVASQELVELSRGLNADQPAWSPDGDLIAFTGFERASGYEIYVVASDGTSLRTLTSEPDDGVSGAHMPTWSPDGTRIAYAFDRYDGSTETERHGIATVDLEGTSETLVDVPDVVESPTWSPDGLTIAFVWKASGTVLVYVANADGGEYRWVVNDVGFDATSPPMWSPNERTLVFSWFDAATSSRGIMVADADGGSARRVLEDDAAASPIWAPEGDLIAFLRDNGRPEPATSLWVMRPNGTDRIELASNLGAVSEIAWQPLLNAAQ